MESSWQLGGFESSEEDKGKDEKDGGKPRREPPRILNMSHLHEGQIDLRPPRTEAKPLAAPLFEELVQSKQETAEDGKEEGEDDDEPTDEPKVAKQKPAIAWQRSAPLPPVEEVPATPQHPPEFNEVMQQLGSEYAEAASGSPPESPVAGEIPAGFRAGEEDQTLLSHDDEPVVAASSPAPAAGGYPSSPPRSPSEFGALNQEPEPEAVQTAAAPAPAYEQQSAPADQGEYKRGLRRGLIAGFITGYALKAFLAHRKQKRFEQATKEQFAAATERFTSLQFQHNQLQQKATGQVEQSQREQQAQQERFERFKAEQPAPERFETPAMPPLPQIEAVPSPHLPRVEALPGVQATAEQEQWVDEHGNEIALQPGQRLERRGWYSVVIDEHGREVPGAIHYGEAFQREQKREQISDDAFGGSDTNAASAAADNAAPAGGSFTALPGIGVSSVPPPLPSDPMIASGQADFDHSLPAGPPATVDLQHRLKEPRNPVVATITSPWLWVAVAVLLIAYFTAALV